MTKTTISSLLLVSGILALAMGASSANAANQYGGMVFVPAANGLTFVSEVAAAQQGATSFIASMGDRGINFLGNPGLSEAAKKAEFAKLLNDSFDMNTIARFSLGTYWNAATPAQRDEYMRLFKTMIIKVYSKRFSDYKGQKFEVENARQDNGKDSVVTSYIVPEDGAKVRVDWRVRNKGGSYKVVDVIVEGVSMSQTQRADFSSVIQRDGGKVDSLLTYLRK